MKSNSVVATVAVSLLSLLGAAIVAFGVLRHDYWGVGIGVLDMIAASLILPVLAAHERNKGKTNG